VRGFCLKIGFGHAMNRISKTNHHIYFGIQRTLHPEKTLDTMQTIKIFLASSGELRSERDGVFKIVADVNKQHTHLHLEVVEWELDLPSGNYEGKRIQDAINPLLSECQIAYVLFYSKAGQFTVEELTLAQKKCDKTFVYFKTGFSTTDRAKYKLYDEVLEIREQLNKANQLIFKEYDDLTRFELHFKDDLNKYLQAHHAPNTTAVATHTPPLHSDITRLPDLHPHFVGRKAELDLLHDAWHQGTTNMVQFVAPGGTGKTMLVTYWLQHQLLERVDMAQPAMIYAWSFYSQGTDEQRQSSSDLFFDRAADFFGIKALPTDPRERGRTLAERIRAQRTLLILDGIEPLQYAPTTKGGLAGKLKDPALAALLRELALNQPGLCLLTTRIAVGDLAGITAPLHEYRLLETFSPTEGATLLRQMGVIGTQKDLETAAEEYDGHALALRLLGNYLVDLLDADVRRRDQIRHLTDEEQSGRHARRVMEAYAIWFQKSHTEAGLAGTPPELLLLRMMGLFDRPAPLEALEALCAEPDIEGLSEGIRTLDPMRLQQAFNHLKKLGLLEENRRSTTAPPRLLTHLHALRDLESLDAHPLVRAYFGQKMEQDAPATWQAANERLYRYYCTLPDKDLPDTLEEMEPLYAAMVFGCRAGLQQEVMDEVYWRRIKRENNHYSTQQLGAFGSDLAALANLFDRVWDKPAQNINEAGQTVLLGWAGYRLRGLGRLQEAVEPTVAGLKRRVAAQNWKNAALEANNLSELYLSLGAITKAIEYGKQAVEYADRSEDDFEKESDRTTLADALHQNGQSQAAAHWFAEAEAMQQQRQPEYPFLYSGYGFQYCELLLEAGNWEAVLERASESLKITLSHNHLLSIALDHLSHARAHIVATQTQTDPSHGQQAESYLNMAVEGLRKAGNMGYIPRGLLDRANWRIQTQRFTEARTDLEEVYEIAESGRMALHLVDYHLAMARLCRAEGQVEAAVQHKAEALQRIKETGYDRRKGEAEGVT
jgi:tetratricopeptide (TPR) repeat protein